MKICAVSDTHSRHWDLIIPKCDIFVFAGDAEINSTIALHDFNDWLATINSKYGNIIIGGNHDTYVEKIGEARCKYILTNGVYLQDNGIIINDLKFYGSPRSPAFNNWSFMYPRQSKEGFDVWKNIPKNTDVLITHTMPYAILDTNRGMHHCGCEILAREIYNKNIKIQIGGHLHQEGNTFLEQDGIKFYNVSVLDEDYKLTHKPTIINI